MDPTKVDLIIRYALARAAHGEKPWDRELGPIHLLKFVYLADLAFAERNGGASFTGADWTFYHYGPWAPAVHDRVRAVAPMIAAEVVVPTKFENDALRWRIDDVEDAEEIEKAAAQALPNAVISAVMRAVKEYGKDTTGLLHHVYATQPMLHAAPGERLDMSLVTARARKEAEPAAAAPVSRRREKKLEEARRELQERARKKLAQVLSKRAAAKPARTPRYDEVFVEGQKWLEQLGGGDVEPFQGEAEFEDAVWKSAWRSDPGTA